MRQEKMGHPSKDRQSSVRDELRIFLVSGSEKAPAVAGIQNRKGMSSEEELKSFTKRPAMRLLEKLEVRNGHSKG